MLFRIWDIACIEGTSTHDGHKIAYFLAATCVTFLVSHASSLMSVCKTRKEVELYLAVAAKFDLSCDTFIA